MKRVRMALRLVRASDDVASRITLLRYFVVNAFRRAVRLPARSGGASSRMEFRLAGVRWSVVPEAAQLGGIHDVWLADEYAAFDGFVASPGAVVIDVGANVGAYALWQRRNMRGDGTIVALEAAPHTCAVLRANVAANDASDVITVVEHAVWSRSGPVEFLASQRSTSTSGIASALSTDQALGTRAMSVVAITLDELLALPPFDGRAIDVLKLDVEGAELGILEAASAETMERLRRIVVEADDRTRAPIEQLLDRAGFAGVGRARNISYFVAREG